MKNRTAEIKRKTKETPNQIYKPTYTKQNLVRGRHSLMLKFRGTL